MILPQWFVPKRRLLKVMQERAAERMQYINIDNSVQNCDRELLEGYKESLSRFAQKQGIAIDFRKVQGEDKTQMHIFKTSMTPHAIDRQCHGLWYFVTPEYKATVDLPTSSANNYFSGLKSTIKNIAYSDEKPEATRRFPHRIRHENKYYNWPIMQKAV